MGNEGSLWQRLQGYNAADESSLVAAANSGQALAQRALIERYLPLMYSVCRRSGVSQNDADDLTQEIVVKVLRGLPSFRAEAKLSSWIYTLAQRAVADFFRGKGRREQAFDHSDPTAQVLFDAAHASPGFSQQSATDAPAEQRDADTLTKVIAALAEPMRSVLLRFYLADDSVAEIATALGLAEGTVKNHLHRGRLLVRQKLESGHE